MYPRLVISLLYAPVRAQQGWMALLSITSAGWLHITHLLYDNKGTYFADMKRSDDKPQRGEKIPQPLTCTPKPPNAHAPPQHEK